MIKTDSVTSKSAEIEYIRFINGGLGYNSVPPSPGWNVDVTDIVPLPSKGIAIETVEGANNKELKGIYLGDVGATSTGSLTADDSAFYIECAKLEPVYFREFGRINFGVYYGRNGESIVNTHHDLGGNLLITQGGIATASPFFAKFARFKNLYAWDGTPLIEDGVISISSSETPKNYIRLKQEKPQLPTITSSHDDYIDIVPLPSCGLVVEMKEYNGDMRGRGLYIGDYESSEYNNNGCAVKESERDVFNSVSIYGSGDEGFDLYNSLLLGMYCVKRGGIANSTPTLSGCIALSKRGIVMPGPVYIDTLIASNLRTKTGTYLIKNNSVSYSSYSTTSALSIPIQPNAATIYTWKEGSKLADQYTNGKAGMGYVTVDQSTKEVIESGCKPLHEILTDPFIPVGTAESDLVKLTTDTN